MPKRLGAGRKIGLPDADGLVWLGAVRVPVAIAQALRARATERGVSVGEEHRALIEAALTER